MFFLFILLIILALGVTIYTSRLGIEIENLIIDTEKPKEEKIKRRERNRRIKKEKNSGFILPLSSFHTEFFLQLN